MIYISGLKFKSLEVRKMNVKQSRIAESRTVSIKQQRCLGTSRRRSAVGTRNSPAVNVETWKQMGYETDRSDFYLLTSWPCGPLRALAYLITVTHSSQSTVFCRHILTSPPLDPSIHLPAISI